MTSPDRPAGPLETTARRRGAGEGRSEQVKNPWPFLLLVAGLCVAGWFLVNWMADSTRIQDCVQAGHRNCAPLDPATGR